MIVRITPPGRRARMFAVENVPRSWDIDGGCATASVPLMLADEELERILLARVQVFGERGMDWSGFVWRRPRRGEAIECAGQAVGLTLAPRRVMYASTALTPWRSVPSTLYTTAWQLGIDVATLVVSIPTGTWASGTVFGVAFDIPTTTTCRLAGTITLPNAATQADLYVRDGGSFGAPKASYTASGAFSTVVAGGSDYNQVRLLFRTNASYSPGADVEIRITGLTVNGTSITSVTPYAVIDHCLDALPSWVLGSAAVYRAWLANPAVTIGSLTFDDASTTDKAKIDAVVGMTDHHFGFYPRRIGGTMYGVPVFAPIDSTPRYIIDARMAIADGLKDRGAEALANNYRAAYQDAEGRSAWLDVADAGDNYLNTIGYSKTAIVDARWTSSATVATAAATTAAGGYSDTEGSLTIAKARTAAGRQCPASIIRPGDMCRVLGLGSPRDMVVRNVRVKDATTLTFAPVGTDLRYLTSRALGQAIVRY